MGAAYAGRAAAHHWDVRLARPRTARAAVDGAHTLASRARALRDEFRGAGGIAASADAIERLAAT